MSRLALLVCAGALASSCVEPVSRTSYGTAPASVRYGTHPALYHVGRAIEPNVLIYDGERATSIAVQGTLPAGLSIDATTGELNGTPTAITAATTIRVTVQNSYGTSFTDLVVTVGDDPPTLTFGGATTLTLTRGVAMAAVTPVLGGGAITGCTVSPALPAGLSLNASTCVVSGTPTALQPARNHVISAANTGGTATLTLNLTVNDVPPAISYAAGYSHTFHRDKTISTLSATNSGGAIVSCTVSPALPAGLSLSSTNCAVSGRPTALVAAASHVVTATNSGGTSTRTLSITVADQTPNFSYAVATLDVGVATPTISPTSIGGVLENCSVSPALPSGLALAGTGCTIAGTPLVPQMVQSYTVTSSNTAGSATATITITVRDRAPVIAYSGGPYVFTAGVPAGPLAPANTGGLATSCTASPALPTGLSLSSACLISGTATVGVAASNYLITAVNSGGSGTATVSIAVNDFAPAIDFSAAGFSFVYRKGTAISTIAPANTGGAIATCTVAPALPAGLAIGANCALSGNPTQVRAATDYTITASNLSGASVQTLTITVEDVPPALSYANPIDININAAATPINPTSTGGTITGCAVAPPLPAGLVLSSACVISGTPTVAAPQADYTVTASNSGGTVSALLRLEVSDVAPTLSYAGAPFTFEAGTAIVIQTPANSGGAITACSSSPPLPAGLSLSSACVLSGTPTSIQAAANYVITATNTGGSVTRTVSVTIALAAPSINYPGTPYTLTRGQTVTPIAPSNGGGTIASCAVSPVLPAGLSLSTGCVISGAPTAVAASASYLVTATNARGSSSVAVSLGVIDPPPTLNYVAAPFTFFRNVAIASQVPVNSGGTITGCSVSPALPAGLSLSTVCVLSGTPTVLSAAANYTITATNAGGSSGQVISIAVVNQPVPVLTYTGSPYVFTRGNAITAQTPGNSGGAIVSCAVSPALPAGLSLSAGCVLSGTPTAVAGTTNYTVTATNAGGNGAVTISITVNAVAPAIAYGGSPFTFTRSSAISAQTPSNTGGASTSCSSSPALPSGLSLSSACVLSGTPSVVVATANYTITATNSGGSGTATISITVNAAAPTLSFAGAPYTFPQNTAITPRTPTNTGGAITACSSSPSLPAGLSLSAACVLSGTPTVAVATASYTITGTNTGGTASTSISITVTPPAPVISFPGGPFTLARGLAAAPISANLAGGPIVTCSVSPTLPAGLSLSSTTCQITGVPTTLLAADDYTVSAMNAGGSGSTTVNIAVVDEIPTISFSPASRVLTVREATPTIGVVNTGGFITSCVVSPELPTGLAISGTSCAITGTPTVRSGVTEYTVSATNSAGTFSTVLSLRVRDQLQIVFDGFTALAGVWNGTPPGSRNVWRMSRDGAERAAITENSNGDLDSFGDGFRPSHGQIAYASRRAEDGSVDGTPLDSYNIWSSNPDGSSPANLTGVTGTGQGSDSAPVHSPDGARIVFSSLLDVNGVGSSSRNIFIMNANGTALTALTTCTDPDRDSVDPVFSPDGQRVYFASRINADGACGSEASGVHQIWRVNAAGGGLTRVTAGLTDDAREPRIYPQASGLADEWLLFVSQSRVAGVSSSSRNVWRVNANGTGMTALTTQTVAGRDSVDAGFSPDGTEIVFASLMNINGVPSASYNIWKMTVDGSNRVPLTLETGAGRSSDQPRFDPTSGLIVFRSRLPIGGTAANSTNIWRMNEDGTGQTPLTRNTEPGLDSDLTGQVVFHQEP